MSFHATLLRQLKKLGLSAEAPPSLDHWRRLLAKISESYAAADSDREMLERSLDISSREMQERWEMLQRSETLMKAIFDSAIDGIVTFDSDGTIRGFNEAAERTFGHRREDVVGKSEIEILMPFVEAGSRRRRSWQNVLLCAGLNRRQERSFLTADEVEIPVEFTLTVVMTDGTRRYALFMRDVSEQRRAERLVEEQRSQMISTSKMAALGEMAGGVAHEINTPLSVFMMYAELLRTAASEPTLDANMIMSSADVIEDTARKVSKIIQGLRNFSRDAGGEPMEPVFADAIIADTVSFCQQHFRSGGVAFDVVSSSDIQVECRSIEISQILLNLLNNARDAVESLPEKWIHLECRSVGDDVEFSVTDSGSGVPAEIREKIMQPFFTTKAVGRGTGLGLSIAKGIVERHGGSLYYDEDSLNTRFVIRLPKTQSAVAVESA